MESWRTAALFGVIAVVLVVGAIAATLIYPMPRRTPRTQPRGPLDLYLAGGGSDPATIAILSRAEPDSLSARPYSPNRHDR